MRTSNIERVRDENVKLREILLDCEKAVGNMDPSKTLVENISELKSENDQLHNELAKALSAPMTKAALLDLLAPTIEAMRVAELWCNSVWEKLPYSERVEVNMKPVEALRGELTRLRAACGEKDQK